MANLPILLEDMSVDSEFTSSDTSHDQNTESTPHSFAERFLSSFLHERNIRWLLVVGAAIVFGSSLMLVTKAWPDWSPVLKYLSILGYTAAAFVFAELGRRRLKLQATYKVLYALTLLLLPTCFMSLMWLSAGTSTQQTLQTIEVIGLLLPATGFLWIASRQILDHLLNGRQSTFLNAYRLLCVAGVLPACSSEVGSFTFLLCCWAVFTVGVIKVNRHTFWLAEEHRLPRVFGFLPILMLGLQFLILTGTRAVSALPPQWIGFSCVLVAFTILMTSRTVALRVSAADRKSGAATAVDRCRAFDFRSGIDCPGGWVVAHGFQPCWSNDLQCDSDRGDCVNSDVDDGEGFSVLWICLDQPGVGGDFLSVFTDTLC
jgi:hypothetical protein